MWTVVKVALLAITLHWLYGYLQFMKIGYHYHTQWPGKCRPIKGITRGAEDGEMVSGDLAIITSGMCFLNSKRFCGDFEGKLFLFDFNKPDDEVKPVHIEWKPDVQQQKSRDFHPHGMTVWHGDKQTTVMVVSHEPNFKDIIEIFIFDDKTKTLKHQESIKDVPQTTIFNDIKATGPRSFYFSNYCQFPGVWLMHSLEVFLRLPLGWVGHYDANTGEMQVVATGMFFPNGVQMSSDGKYVYISNIGEQSIDMFKRFTNNSLQFEKRVELYTIPDNMALEADDKALWVGSINVVWKNMRNIEDPDISAPSQILRVELTDGLPSGKVQQVYAGNGEVVHGTSSLGLFHKSKLLIGTVHNNAAICDVDYLQ